jgi:hypothetical protein
LAQAVELVVAIDLLSNSSHTKTAQQALSTVSHPQTTSTVSHPQTTSTVSYPQTTYNFGSLNNLLWSSYNSLGQVMSSQMADDASYGMFVAPDVDDYDLG